MNALTLFQPLLCISVCTALYVPAHATTNVPSPALQARMQRLHCTQDASEVQQVLADWCSPTRPWPLALPQDQRVEILDALLWAMDQAADRFPTLAATLENCVLGWNLCDLRVQRQWVDRSVKGETCVPTSPTPAGWLGLKQWGLIVDPQVQRRIPARLRPAAPDRAAHPQQLHRSYHQHCFPHPVTGRLFDEETRPTAYGGPSMGLGVPLCPHPTAVPPLREQLCPPPPPTAPVLTAADASPGPTLVPESSAVSAAPVPKIAAPAPVPPPSTSPAPSTSVPPSSGRPVGVVPPRPPVSAAAAISLPPAASAAAVARTPSTLSDLNASAAILSPSAVSAAPTQTAAPVPDPALAALPTPVPVGVASAHDPEFGRPVAATAASTAAGSSHTTALTPPGANGFSGAFSHDWPLNGSGRKFSATATWAPAEYWFVRMGVANAYEQKGSQPWSYSWGVGYDDWHPGTWSAQLNHWGPIAPGKGLDIKNAVFTTSYKTDHASLKERNMTLAHGIDLPVGQPRNGKLHSTWQWAFLPTWFLRVGVSAPLQGLSPLQWSYGLGRSDWRPFTWSLEYNNWGPNTAFQPNFKKNGTVTLAWKWAH